MWFRISCTVELNNGLSNFRIVGIDEYSHQENKVQGRLTDTTLVPIIKDDQFESVAEAILKQYYPEALLAPVQVDVRRFAKNIGLTAKEAHASVA